MLPSLSKLSTGGKAVKSGKKRSLNDTEKSSPVLGLLVYLITDSVMFVQEIVVSIKRKGIATALLEDAIVTANKNKRNVKQVHLIVHQDNIAALELYKHLGFVELTADNLYSPKDNELYMSVEESTLLKNSKAKTSDVTNKTVFMPFRSRADFRAQSALYNNKVMYNTAMKLVTDQHHTLPEDGLSNNPTKYIVALGKTRLEETAGRM